MIYYYKPIIDKDLVLSIDNIILDVSISRSELRDLLDTMIQNIAKGKRIEIQSWESHKPGTFHDLRHLCASIMLMQGVNVKVAQQHLGHRDLSTTLGIYTHVLPSVSKEAAQKIGALVYDVG